MVPHKLKPEKVYAILHAIIDISLVMRHTLALLTSFTWVRERKKESVLSSSVLYDKSTARAFWLHLTPKACRYFCWPCNVVGVRTCVQSNVQTEKETPLGFINYFYTN